MIFCCFASFAQFRLKGTVFDSSRTYPMEAVTVISSSGKATITDANGRYSIEVTEKDSVWFSYLGKATVKYAVARIHNSEQFDIALHINIPVLKEVIVKPRNYRLDSLQNRQDYARGFNFQRPDFESMTSIGPHGAGIDINELIRLFQFRKNRSMASLRERLVQQERDKYIDYRFSKAVVQRLTGLTGAERDSFMLRCRPSYEFCLMTNDYQFQSYIKDCFENYRQQKSSTAIKKED